jgi:hypothetical protein
MAKAVRKSRNDKRTPAAYQVQIAASWRQQVSSIFRTGDLLIEAKAKLGHGEWGAMFKGGNRLPFSQETARCLMKIAKNPILNSKESWHLLPPSWWTIFILSRAPTADLKNWLESGTVNCETTANDAQALYPAWDSPRTTKPALNMVKDPDGDLPLRRDIEDLDLDGPSAERSQTLETLKNVGFNMDDLGEEMADIAAGGEGTQEPARSPAECRALLMRLKIDECLDRLESDRDSIERSPEFEQWVLRAGSRLRKLLDRL